LADGGVDYTRFVHLAAADNPAPLAQDDGFPGPNLPTGQWVSGQMITDSVRLDVTAAPPGSYQLAIGFYRNLGDRWPRLTAVAADGSFYPDNRALLPLALIKTGSD